ncbi:MAG TPA: S-adenosylmethionine decarboxylase [Gemmatimonadales bacterium]
MHSAFNHQTTELAALPGGLLADGAALSAIVVAAAGAVGMPAHGPPGVHQGSGTLVVAMLCREGHIVVHTSASEGLCFVDIAARAPADVGKGMEVIVRRLRGS